MENPCNSANGNLPRVSGDETLKKAKESCIKLLKYRIEHHVEVVIDTIKEVWRLVLCDSVNNEENSWTVTSYDGIICSGYGDVPQEISDKQENISVRLSEDLVLVKLQKEANGDIYYVLSDSGKKYKVMDATSTAELECHGKILCISKGQDPPEAMSCEIIKRYFYTNKKSCSSIDKRYIEIIRNGDVQALKKEVLDVVDVKCTNTENGWTMLHYAAYHGNIEIVSFLISIGCHVHVQDSICARKPVHISAREGHTDIIEFFLLHGLSVNEADQIGWTLLHYAAWKGNLEAVRCLIQKKAQVDFKDKCLGKTPLLVATEEGHLEVVKLLVSSGSNIEEKANKGETPLLVAVFKGYMKVVEFLVDNGANLNIKSQDGWTLLHYAAFRGHLNVVEFLVDNGANIFAVHKNGFRPLHCAASKGHLNIVELLVDRGANLNAGSISGWGPLPLAAFEGHLDVVKFLADKGANLNAEGHNSWTPLHCSAFIGHLNVVEFLVSGGADVNALDKLGKTPLDCGVEHIKVASYLTEKMLNIFQDQGKFEDALKFYRELLQLQKKKFRHVHPGTLTVHRRIAEMLYDQCQYSEALDILKDVLPSQRDLCSTDFITLRYKCELKLLMSETNINYNEAAKTVKEMFDIQEADLSTNHCITCQEPINSIPKQDETVKMEKEDINEKEADLDTNHCIECWEPITSIPKQDETVEMEKEDIDEKEADVDTNHCIKCQEPINSIPKQDEAVKMVNVDINEEEAEVGNVNDNLFRQTKASDFKTRFERKASLFFKNGKSIYGCMIIFWLFSMICHHAILCFQQ